MTNITRRACLLGVGSLAVAHTARAQQPKAVAEPAVKPIAIVGAELLRPDADPLPKSTVVLTGERISYAGSDEGQASGAEIIRVGADHKVTAGFVDLLTHVGVEEVSLEPSTMDTAHRDDDPVRAAFRTADGYNPASTLVPICRRGGLTSVGVMPGPIPLTQDETFGLVSGQSTWADLTGDVPAEAIARESLGLHVHLHDAMHGNYGHSRGTIMLRLRELFDDTRTYNKSKAAYGRRQLRELGASRLDYEVVSAALDGTLPTVIHVDRASDIVTALELGADNGLRVVLASCAEGWRVAKHIAKADVGVILYPLDHGPRTFAARYARESNAALLHKAGVTVAFSTGESHNARKLGQAAGNAIRAGLPYSVALDAVTRAPARLMMMESYGEVAEKQMANVVVWSGDPFELSTRPTHMFIRGKKAGLRTRQTALFERYRAFHPKKP